MTDSTSRVVEKLRRLRADLIIKTGDLKVTARKLRVAQDNGRVRRAAKLQEELDQIKQTISDLKGTIVEYEAEEVQDELPVAR